MGKSGFQPASAPMMPQRMALGAAAVAALLRRAQVLSHFHSPKMGETWRNPIYSPGNHGTSSIIRWNATPSPSS